MIEIKHRCRNCKHCTIFINLMDGDLVFSCNYHDLAMPEEIKDCDSFIQREEKA